MNQGQVKRRPRSTSKSTKGMSPQWEPRSQLSPCPALLSGPTPPTVILSAESVRVLATSPHDAPRKTSADPYAPSTTPEPTTDAQTIPALAAATLSLFLTVLPARPAAPTLEFITGRGRAGFQSPGPAVTKSRGGYFRGDPHPAPVRGVSPLIP